MLILPLLALVPSLLSAPSLDFVASSQKPPKAEKPLIAPGATLQLISDMFSFTEGTTEDERGNVFFTDQPNDRIMEYKTDGELVPFMSPAGRSNGMWFDHAGRLVMCADENNQLWIRNRGQTNVVVREYDGKLLNGPNDVWVRRDGGMYITDPMYARPYWKRDPKPQMDGNYVFFLSSNLKDLHPVITDLNTPNGIIGTPDDKYLYIGDLGLNATYRYRIDRDGSLSDKTFFCPLGSDGMTMDARGDVYLTGHGVTVYSPEGVKLAEIPVPQPWVGHVCFGGAHHDKLFIAASRGFYSLQMNVKGAF